MSYRDDRDADQARIAALEAELAAARERVDELEGRREQALVLASPGELATRKGSAAHAKRWLGAPLELEMIRTFDRAYPTDRLEDLVPVIREVSGEPGMVEVLRTSLTWRAMARQGALTRTFVMIVVRDGKTTLTAGARLHQQAGALFGGVGGGLGGGGLILPITASAAVPVLAPLFLLTWFGGIYLGTRTIFKRVARQRAELIQQLFDRLVAAIEAG